MNPTWIVTQVRNRDRTLLQISRLGFKKERGKSFFWVDDLLFIWVEVGFWRHYTSESTWALHLEWRCLVREFAYIHLMDDFACYFSFCHLYTPFWSIWRMRYYILVCMAVPLWAARNVQFMTKPLFLWFNASRYKGTGMLFMVFGLLPMDVPHLQLKANSTMTRLLTTRCPRTTKKNASPS